MRTWLAATPVLVGLMACGPSTVRVAGVTVQLHTPASVDPLDGADALVVRVLDSEGNEVASGSGAPGSGLVIPPITTFGQVEIEVTARSGSQVLAAARSGPVRISASDERVLDLLFLPVNQAVPLTWTPTAHRIGHSTVLLPDGQVLLLGGRSPGSGTVRTDSELWSIATGFAGDGPVLPEGVANARSAPLPDGSTLIAGGDNAAGASAVVLAVSADGTQIDALPPLTQAAARPCVATHPDFGALVLTGQTAELNTSLGRVGSTPLSTPDVQSCAGADGYVVTAGGAGGWGVLDLVDAQGWPFDLDAASTWLPNQPDLDAPHVVALPDGRFWTGGGYGFDATVSTRIVRPERLEITPAAELDGGRTDGHAAPWRDEHVVLAGGWSDDVKSEPVRSVLVHHPDTGEGVQIAVPARDPSLTVLGGGTLLLTGGLDEGGEPAGAFGVIPWLSDED